MHHNDQKKGTSENPSLPPLFMLQFQIRSFYPNAWRKDGNSKILVLIVIINMALSKMSQNLSEMISIQYCDSPGKPEQTLELVGFDIMHYNN